MADNYIERQYEAYQARKAAWEKERKYKKKKPADPAEAPHRSGAFLQNQVKKVVAVHDLSGVGHVSLMAVIPVLSSMGFQVCPLPTAVLSAHTQYPTYSFLDLTDEMKRIIENWEKMNVHFDTFYTGYLGSPQQAQIVEEFILKFRGENDMVVVDPVLGDNGHLYKGITEEMVTEMKKLIHLADVITPNLTELYYLLDMPYQEHITDAELKQALKTLSDRGPAIVIATSVPVSGDPRSTSVYAYNRFGDRYWKVTCPYLPAHYPGTGTWRVSCWRRCSTTSTCRFKSAVTSWWNKRPRESVHTYLPDGEFHFAEGYQGIEQTDMPVVSEGGDRDVRFFYLSGVEQVSALGSCQQRLCGGVPFASVPKGDVGDGGIGEESVAHDEHVVGCIAQSEGFVKHTAVGLLVAVVDVVLHHQLQTVYRADVVRKVFHANHVAGIGQTATGAYGIGFRTEIIHYMEVGHRTEKSTARIVHAAVMQRGMPHLAVFNAERFNKEAHRLSVSFLHIRFGHRCGR